MNQIDDFERGLYLSELRKGDEGIIDRMETNKENLIRLGDMGLGKGIAFRVINFAPLGDPIEIKIRGFYLSIRKTQAKCIRVKKRKIEDQ
jgi:ferrous iron transport protein A